MKMDKEKHIETVDVLDKELIGLFSQIKDSADARNENTGDEFTRQVMHMLPRRDISLWLVALSTTLGVVVVGLAMGLEASVEFMGEIGDFFLTLGSFALPSFTSTLCVMALLVVLYVICKGLLCTEDYCLDD